jgi:hypothetical protein
VIDQIFVKLGDLLVRRTKIKLPTFVIRIAFLLIFSGVLFSAVIYFTNVGLCSLNEPVPNAFMDSFRWACISKDPDFWKQLGTFFSVFINPLVGLVTVCLLALSYQQNQKVLNESRNDYAIDISERRFLRSAEALGGIAHKTFQFQMVGTSYGTTDLISASDTYIKYYGVSQAANPADKEILEFKKRVVNVVALLSVLHHLYSRHDDKELKFMFAGYLLSETSPNFIASLALWIMDIDKSAGDFDQRMLIASTLNACLKTSGLTELIDLVEKKMSTKISKTL